ncbi:MAG: NADH-quinone oxidoreductase subunit NuoF [Chloroflexota bacterium]
MPSKTLIHKITNPEILKLAESHFRDKSAILEIFQEIQARHGGLNQDVILDVARSLNIPAQRAFGVASFYSMLSLSEQKKPTIRVCDGPPCWLKEANQVHKDLRTKLGDEWHIERTSCLGLCDRAPAALVEDEQCGPLTGKDVSELPKGWRGERRDYSKPLPGEVRVLLANIQTIDPQSLDSALEHGAYQSLQKALKAKPEDVIQVVEEAGVRGRGGAGFSTGTKWRFVSRQARMPKYIVCNADESEPLIFKDRVLIESNPHQLLEGMELAGYAVGASQGFIYIRGEYQPQIKILKHAIREAEAHGFLGENVCGTDFSFHIHIHKGAGAYICGEETALLESLEGRRGEPRVRPPYPTVSGYRGYPTVVNNVETFSTIPPIIIRGADWYRSIGDASTPGTKLYTLTGHVQRPGLFEAPYGITVRQIIEDFGEGMHSGSKFHLALTGGAAGTIVPPSKLDVPLTYESVSQGVSLGAGGVLVCDHTISPAAVLRQLLHFFVNESCGKCAPCRIGTVLALEILNRVVAGKAKSSDLEQLSLFAEVLQKDSFCGLGQSVALPIKTTLENYELL